MESYAASETTSFAIYNKWYAFVENGYLAGANYVDYYVKFHNAYRTTQTEVRRVDILNKGADQTGIRVSFDGKDVTENAYSGSVYVTAKDFGGLTLPLRWTGKPFPPKARWSAGHTSSSTTPGSTAILKMR